MTLGPGLCYNTSWSYPFRLKIIDSFTLFIGAIFDALSAREYFEEKGFDFDCFLSFYNNRIITILSYCRYRAHVRLDTPVAPQSIDSAY